MQEKKMSYVYRGNGLDSLYLSYREDQHLFITDVSRKFPERNSDLEEIKILKSLLFPNYWNCGLITDPENRTLLESKINIFGNLLFDGIKSHISNEQNPIAIVDEVFNQLPGIRRILKDDVRAAYNGDPAARSYTEIIRSYPGFHAMVVQRIAHILYQLDVVSYPRELTENIHTTTGIDIHPGATIGEHFFIDHGTGVVIGETVEIGDHVRIYQGVTLGALHFEKEKNGILKKGYQRHPTIGNHVVIGAGAKIIGPISIGDHVSIGSNSWIEEDIPDYTTVYISEHPKLIRQRKGEK